MRTEIVKIVNALYKHNHEVACKYAEKLKENYHKLDWKDEDRFFIKRILNIFYDDGEFSSNVIICDKNRPQLNNAIKKAQLLIKEEETRHHKNS